MRRHRNRLSVMTKLLSFLVLFLLFSSKCFGQMEGWKGTYEYIENSGPTVGGTSVVVEYKLKIDGASEGVPAVLEIDGYQRLETIYCDVEEEASTISILFRSYENGSVKNKYGKSIYKPQQKLFSLIKNKENLITVWHYLRKNNNKVKNAGAYFSKLK